MVLFQILKAIINSDKHTLGLSILLSILFEDAGVNLSDPVTLHKLKHNIVSLRPKGHALKISPAGMLAMKKEISEIWLLQMSLQRRAALLWPPNPKGNLSWCPVILEQQVLFISHRS